MHLDDGAAGLQRSVSEPLFAGSPTPTPGDGRTCVLSPSGLTSPALRAASLLHQRHRSDMVRFGNPANHPPDDEEDGDGAETPFGRHQQSWDLRRAVAHRQEDASRSMGRLAKLVHVRHSGNSCIPEEKAFAMPHPFLGHAPRELLPPQGRAPHVLKPLSARRRRRDTHLLSAPMLLGSWSQLSPLSGSPTAPGSDAMCDSEAPGNRGQDKDSGGREPQGEEIASISVMALYNSVVDGLAGHLIVDTRSADDFDESHIWGAIDLEEALTYRGKHILLVSQSGVLGAAERSAVAALHATQGVLSLKSVEGGMQAWARAYPFMCERTAASLDEEHQQRRERARHIYPSQVLPWLFISGIEAAQDHQVLRDLGMTHVLSILADPDKARVPKFCARLKLPLRDEVNADIAAVFDEAWEFVRAARGADGGRLLIHCKMVTATCMSAAPLLPPPHLVVVLDRVLCSLRVESALTCAHRVSLAGAEQIGVHPAYGPASVW